MRLTEKTAGNAICCKSIERNKIKILLRSKLAFLKRLCYNDFKELRRMEGLLWNASWTVH